MHEWSWLKAQEIHAKSFFSHPRRTDQHQRLVIKKKSPAELGLLLIGLSGSRKQGGGNHDCWEEPGSPSHGEPGISGIAAVASLAF